MREKTKGPRRKQKCRNALNKLNKYSKNVKNRLHWHTRTNTHNYEMLTNFHFGMLKPKKYRVYTIGFNLCLLCLRQSFLWNAKPVQILNMLSLSLSLSPIHPLFPLRPSWMVLTVTSHPYAIQRVAFWSKYTGRKRCESVVVPVHVVNVERISTCIINRNMRVGNWNFSINCIVWR